MSNNQQGNGSGGAIAKTVTPEPFLDMLKSHVGQIQSALPKTFALDRMIRLATSEFRLRPELKECVPASVFGAVVQASQLALDFSLRHCFLVPYKRKRKDKQRGWIEWHECQLIISFQGYIELARRSGELNDLDAHVVYEGDTFDYQYGTTKFLTHKPTLGKRGNKLAAYSVANFKNGSSMFDVMPWAEIEKIKGRTKSRDKAGNIVGPWATDEDEMARKTAVRRLAKYLPLSVELRRALDLEDAAALGKDQHLSNAIEIISQAATGTYEQIPLDDDEEGLEGDEDGEGNQAAQDRSGEESQAGADDGAPPFEPGSNEPAGEGKPKRPGKKRFAEAPAAGETLPTGDAAGKEPPKEKTLYQKLRDRLAEATTLEALDSEATGIRGLKAGNPPDAITEENRTVLLATIGRRRNELS